MCKQSITKEYTDVHAHIYNHASSIAIFLIYSHYDPGKPFWRGATFFATPYIYLKLLNLKPLNTMIHGVFPPPPPPHPSEKREGKTTPSSVNLKEKAGVPCPFLKKRGHCLKGDKRDFSHKFTLTTQTRVKSKTKSLWKVLYTPYVPYPNNNPLVAPLPFNSF